MVEETDECINRALQEHQVTCEEWTYRALAEDLHTWARRLNVEFRLDIPEAALMFARLRGRRLGHYRTERNGFGLRDEIALGERHVTDDEYWQVLTTLCHELLHSWQHHHGVPPGSTAFNYHNAQFRRLAGSIGLVVDRWGHTHLAEGATPFRDLLAEHGVEAPQLPEPPARRGAAGNSKLKLWMCPCGVRARVGRAEFRAKCLDCGGVFQRQD